MLLIKRSSSGAQGWTLVKSNEGKGTMPFRLSDRGEVDSVLVVGSGDSVIFNGIDRCGCFKGV